MLPKMDLDGGKLLSTKTSRGTVRLLFETDDSIIQLTPVAAGYKGFVKLGQTYESEILKHYRFRSPLTDGVLVWKAVRNRRVRDMTGWEVLR